MCVCVWQVIRAANAEVARGLQNPFYSVWQKLPGPPSKGQVAITSFHFMMNSLLQEVPPHHHSVHSACTFCICIVFLFYITFLSFAFFSDKTLLLERFVNSILCY